LVEPEVEIGDIPDKMGEGKKGSWVLIARDTAGANLEEISGIDDENYVIISEDDIVDGIATFVARCILEDPKSKVLASLNSFRGLSRIDEHLIQHYVLHVVLTVFIVFPSVIIASAASKGYAYILLAV
jgi:hypothetical protein